jgi:DUF1680 family protein
MTIAPVLPKSEFVTLWPLGLGDVTLTGGFWTDRLNVNGSATLLAIHDRMREAGTLDNFRLAAAGATSGIFGRSFFDSDVFKWIEAVAWEMGRLGTTKPDARLVPLLEEAVQLVVDAQEADGYLNTWFQVMNPSARFTDLESGHELYTGSHLIQAGIAMHRAMGDDRLLLVSTRFADLLLHTFGPERRDWTPEHPGIEMTLVELGRVTGNPRYQALADFFLTARGRRIVGEAHFGATYRQDEAPYRSSRRARGHAVMLTYLASGAVDLYLETGEQALLDASAAQWTDMLAKRSFLTGGAGSRFRDESFGDAYELNPDRSYAETCTAVGGVMWAWRMLLATGDVGYSDHIERLLFNAVLPGVDLTGTRFFYANPLQVRNDHLEPEDGIGASVRQPWFDVACCPANLARLLSSLPSYMATSTRNGVQLHQYASSGITAALGGGLVQLDVSTEYPWAGQVRVRVLKTPATPWALELRVPGWAHAAEAKVNDEDSTVVPAGMAHIERVWTPGDVITLTVDVTPRFTYADPRIDAARGCVAVERGPIVYCLEGVDVPDSKDLDLVVVDTGRPPCDAASDQLSGGPTLPFPTVTVRGGALRAVGDVAWPYSREPQRPAIDDCELRLVPYFAWANRGMHNPMRVWLPT